jgi:hypothetical protein
MTRVNMLLVVLLVLTSTAVSAASEPTVRELLSQKFSVVLLSDSYGTFQTKLELQPTVNFEESLATTEAPALIGSSAAATPGWFETLRVIVDLKSTDGNSGSAQVFFVEATDGSPNITFDFALSKPSSSASFLESSGKYKTNTFAYGVFWWRFSSQSEFTLQFVDHIFSNTTTLQGSSVPLILDESKSSKPWYQTWGLVLVTGGVFLIRLWLNNMQSRRQLKQEKIAEMGKKKQ